MHKSFFAFLPVVLASALAYGQTLSQFPGAQEPAFKDGFMGSTLTCSQAHALVIPGRLVKRARLKAKLLTLLRDSLFDDAKGIVNIEREKEIKKLANKLKNEKAE